MEADQKKSKSLLKKLTYHYRILVINDDTYEEKLSFKLNRLNVFVLTGLFAFFLIILTTILIAFTPLRTYIPGYTAPGLRSKAIHLQAKTDSLEHALLLNSFYLTQLKKVLNNEITIEDFERQYNQKTFDPDTLKLTPGKMDSLLRKEVAQREKFKVGNSKAKFAYNFIPPVKGIIVNNFDKDKKHFGIDIALKKGSTVKSIADGRVIFANWSPDTGNTIIIQHPNNIISIYKHNSKLLRQIGDKVQKGEAITLSGNTGEQTTGPHLHFELWIKDKPVNPVDFINFKK
jgi:murein DD-endopeptidase MepM/ murein hydrolase activator NlpD